MAPESLPQPPVRFRAITSAYEEAAVRRPQDLRVVAYRFAGRPAQLRIVGPRLAEDTGLAFSHLREPGEIESRPYLQIDLWQEDLPDSFLPEERAEQTWGMVYAGELRIYGGGRYLEFLRPGSITWFDRHENRMVGWRSSDQPLTIDEISKPLPLLLGIWYADQGVHVVHSGLVANERGAALLGGQGGSGKTTTSIAASMGGLGFLGDDHVGLESVGGGYLGHSLYNGVRLAPDNMVRFPTLEAHAHLSDQFIEDKHLVFLNGLLPRPLPRSAPIRAVILPRLEGAPSCRLAPASKAEALLRLAPSSVTMPLKDSTQEFAVLADLVRGVPCYRLSLGPDVSEVAGLIDCALLGLD